METSHSVDVRMDSVKVRNETLSSSYDDTSDTESQTSDTYRSTLDDSIETQQVRDKPIVMCQDWVIYAPAAFLGCGSRLSGSLSGIEPQFPVTR